MVFSFAVAGEGWNNELFSTRFTQVRLFGAGQARGYAAHW